MRYISKTFRTFGNYNHITAVHIIIPIINKGYMYKLVCQGHRPKVQSTRLHVYAKIIIRYRLSITILHFMPTLENHLSKPHVYMIIVNRLFQHKGTTSAPVYIHTERPHAWVMKICSLFIYACIYRGVVNSDPSPWNFFSYN